MRERTPDGASGSFLAASTHWRAAHTPGERELRLLDVLARQAADYFDRSRAQEALRASEESYRTLFENMDEGVALCELVRDGHGAATELPSTSPTA